MPITNKCTPFDIKITFTLQLACMWSTTCLHVVYAHRLCIIYNTHRSKYQNHYLIGFQKPKKHLQLTRTPLLNKKMSTL